MSFNFDQFTKTMAAEQSEGMNSGNSNGSRKVGFFKLANDGDEALVRFNIRNTGDFKFAMIHQLGASAKFMKVACLHEPGAHDDVHCPFCGAVHDGIFENENRARTHMYLEMLVRYKDKTTGQFGEVQPVVWDRTVSKNGYQVNDFVDKLNNFGDLTKSLFRIVRHGARGDMKTTYSIDYAIPTVYKPELIPEDFAAFDPSVFDLSKHSYWVKTAEEMNTYLNTGSFPDRKSSGTEQKQTVPQTVYVQTQPTSQMPQSGFNFKQPQPSQTGYQTTMQQPTYTQQAAPQPAFTQPQPANVSQPATKNPFNFHF